MQILDIVQAEAPVEKVSDRLHGEYIGRCPSCGGARFTVWPEYKQGSYRCLDCKVTGDTVKYLVEFRGFSYSEAWKYCGRRPQSRWQKMADARQNYWMNHLLSDGAQEARSFLRGIGLKDGTIQICGLGWNPKDLYLSREQWGLEPRKRDDGTFEKLWIPRGLVIPCEDKYTERLTIRRPESDCVDRYAVVQGSSSVPATWSLRGNDFIIVVESELDGMLVWQEADDHHVGVIALGTVKARPDPETNRMLRNAYTILLCLDSEQAGAREATQFWVRQYGAKVQRWPVPFGTNPSSAYQQGLDIHAWVWTGLRTAWSKS